jgi:hypothetical protein
MVGAGVRHDGIEEARTDREHGLNATAQPIRPIIGLIPTNLIDFSVSKLVQLAL